MTEQEEKAQRNLMKKVSDLLLQLKERDQFITQVKGALEKKNKECARLETMVNRMEKR